MEEIYKKILNEEINLKYLSPVDLVNLEIYLEKIHFNLNDLLKMIKEKNATLENKKMELQSEILLEEEII